MKNGVGEMRKIKWYPVVLKTKDGNQWGYIDQNGHYVTPFIFQEAHDFQENGLAIVKKDGCYGIINEQFQYVVLPKYEAITSFSEGRAQVLDNDGYYVINEQGHVLTKKSYSFIGAYHDKRAIFADTTSEGKYLYGYLDQDGNEVIPLQYEMAHDFHNGKAVVRVREKEHALIDRAGKILQTYPYYTVGVLREGKMSFQKDLSDLFGYIDERGDIVIKPQFRTAQQFQNDRAIVSNEKNHWNRYGLIDQNGKVVMELKYDDLRMLGSERLAVGKAQNPEIPYFTSIYAVATTDGQFLSDFNYFGLMNYEHGFASAYDENNTFFIDLEGKIAKHLPIVSGSGTLMFIGDLIKANVDFRLAYYRRDGHLIWQQNTSFPLSQKYYITEKKFRPNKDYIVYVPQIAGMKDKAIEKKVNEKLEILSQVKDLPSNVPLDYTYTGDFSVEFFQKNLLVLELEGYHYPLGAAHGMPYRNYPHVDLVTGQFFTFADLFKENSDYVAVLSEIIQKQIDSGESEFSSYIFPNAYKGIKPDQPFYVMVDKLAIYFEPYEIAAYAAGFPTFYIPYEEIMDLIDTEGAFWKSFH